MKAVVTIIDDCGTVIYRDQVLAPVKEEIINSNPDLLPIKEARFNFVVRQLVADIRNLEDKTTDEI